MRSTGPKEQRPKLYHVLARNRDPETSRTKPYNTIGVVWGPNYCMALEEAKRAKFAGDIPRQELKVLRAEVHLGHSCEFCTEALRKKEEERRG